MLFRFQPQDTPCVVGYNLPLTRKQPKRQDRNLNEYVSPITEVPRHQDNKWADKWGTPIIHCSIMNFSIKEALCDLGAEDNIMPLAIYKESVIKMENKPSGLSCMVVLIATYHFLFHMHTLYSSRAW